MELIFANICLFLVNWKPDTKSFYNQDNHHYKNRAEIHLCSSLQSLINFQVLDSCKDRSLFKPLLELTPACICSRLLRCSTARVSSVWFSQVIPSKIQACKPFLFTESSLVLKTNTEHNIFSVLSDYLFTKDLLNIK